MNRIGAVVFSAFIAMAATSAYGQVVSPAATTQGPAATVATPSTSVGMERQVPGPRPLFTIGGVAVQVWTPVSPPYNTQAYTNLSGRSIGEPG
jgi:hypothetical protein